MSHPFRVLVVDDEKPARDRLMALLGRQPAVQTSACSSGEVALRTISNAVRSRMPIEIIFVDVQMPEMDGFAMIEALYALMLDTMPVVVFATAYDEYALRAFDAHAVDYLLKPYSDERFEIALNRAIRIVRGGTSDALVERMQALLRDVGCPTGATTDSPRRRYLERLPIKERGRIRLVNVSDIRWIGAEGVYVTIHTVREKYLLRDVLGHLEAQLDPQRFVRIHRSHIVNFDFVDEMVQDAHGDYEVLLKDATPLKVSRMYRSRLEERLHHRL